LSLASEITLESIPAQLTARSAVLSAAADEALMDAFRAEGDERVFEELVRRHSASAYRAALAIVGLAGTAEDAVQESFLRLVRARRDWKPGSNFRSWFYSILRNVCRDELRRVARPEPDRAEPSASAEPSAALDLREQAAAAARAFAELPEGEREVLSLRIHGGLEFSQIASAVGISAEAAKKRACRALELLRRRLSGRIAAR
jgi:RNA polymerase sigma-70 factor (ECF subfamily)